MKHGRQQTMKALERIVGEVQKFYDKPLKGNRTPLAEMVKKIENGGYGIRLHRKGYKDKNEGNAIKFYVHQQSMEHNMTPDIEIWIVDGVIRIQNDIIWKTIYGIHEQIQEDRAYE